MHRAVALVLACCAVLARSAMAANTPRINVLGGPLAVCCAQNKAGYQRDGTCRAIDEDHGSHTVCAVVTQAFLDFTRSRGNDLCTPHPEWAFPGLRPGDRWCLCAVRWREALQAKVAPPVVLESTDGRTLEYVSLEDLQAHRATGE